ncbi:F0F1 ATP synthase subunit delta [Parvularcula dongshanensis]|uniref:ATP synthase subunit delta n=1 Tax=Parvularcula dongshanensis TaxID=1173995 RepID=A0A840HZA2_9PROT|nr:F0F1 ATP synthase subunit delta [Parvularcula dongshanensis]MBB4657757.1 F-type H+-transporting ATPase subunit delta [Parvularcula dongshanensis]
MQDDRAAVAERYAGAFFDLAREQDAIAPLEEDMKGLRAAMSSSEDLRRLALSPVFESEDKTRGMTAVLDRMGAHALTRNLVLLLIRNGRLFAMDGVARAFLERAAAARGEVAAEAVSAHPLSEEQEAALRAEIGRAVGKDVNLTTQVDPSLLGGLIVKVGSRMMDNSLKTKLNRLHARLKEA